MEAREGTGRTTRQIKGAPKDAVFILPTHRMIPYAQRLAAQNDRQDLEFKPIAWVTDQRWRGLRRDVVLDHACAIFMTGRDFAEADLMFDYLAAHNRSKG